MVPPANHRHAPSALNNLLYNYSADGGSWQGIEAARKQSRASRMVIIARWFCIAMLAAYGAISAAFYAGSGDFGLVTHNIAVPVLALGFAVGYNAWFHFSYEWFARFRYLPHAQLLFDLVVVTVVIHFSGGVVSWFWAVYLLVTVEAGFVLETQREVLFIGFTGAVMYGFLLLAELGNTIAPVPMPLVNYALQHNFTFVALTWTWVAMMNGAVSVISGAFAAIIRKNEAALRKLVVMDAVTGLYNRDYLFQRLQGEIQRSREFGRSVTVMLVEVDGFAAYNAAYGHDAGDELLGSIGGILKTSTSHAHAGADGGEYAVVCRLEGATFGVLLPEAARAQAKSVADKVQERVHVMAAAVTAEALRTRIARYVTDRRGVTLSIGVASYGKDVRNADHLVQCANKALQQAIAEGGNRVHVSDEIQELGAQLLQR